MLSKIGIKTVVKNIVCYVIKNNVLSYFWFLFGDWPHTSST